MKVSMSAKQTATNHLVQDKVTRLMASLHTRNLLLLMMLSMVWASVAYAWNGDDPLETTPAVIHAGMKLPGEDSPAPCPVHKDFSTPLSLSDAVDITLCNNPQIQMAWANIKIEAGAVGEADAAYLPTLSSSVSRVRDKTTYPGFASADTTLTDNTVTASLSWRLFDFGVRSANRLAAEDTLSAALANQDATLQKTLSSVVQAYFDAFTARATVMAKTEDKTVAKKILVSARKRAQQGAAGNSDVLQAITALAKASLDKNRAQGEYRKALAVLVYSLGVPGETQIRLPDELATSTELSRRDLHDWLDLAQKTHPAILAARAQLAAARNKVDATSAEGLPSFDLAINYYQNGRPGQSLVPTTSHESTIGITLTIPLFEGFVRTYKVQGAKAQAEEKTAELDDTEHKIVMDVVKAYADADTALNNLQASESLLNAALNALAVVEHKYDQGAADIVALLNTQSALADAQQQRIQSLDEWRSSRLKLLASAGQLNRSFMN
jgi:outer membrane protein